MKKTVKDRALDGAQGAPRDGEINGADAEATFVDIPLGNLVPRPNGRKTFEPKKLAELAGSLKASGFNQPLLVRPTATVGQYEIVCGERRWRAATAAKLSIAPCVIKPLSDAEAAFASASENLQRVDLAHLEEAEEFAALAEQFSLKEIARRLSKPDTFIAARLPLVGAITEVKEDLVSGAITLGHALAVARLDPALQSAALSACFHTQWSGDEQRFVPDKTSPRTVAELETWIKRYVLLDLSKAPFKLDDPTLRADGLTCLKCPQRAGSNPSLFSDIEKGDTCMNPVCFAQKQTAFVNIEAKRLAGKAPEPVPIISETYSTAPPGMLSQHDFADVTKNKCEGAEAAVWGDGAHPGKKAWICRSADCQTHKARFRESAAAKGGTGVASPGAKPDAGKNARRRQELLDIKVNEMTRRALFLQAMKKFKHPLGREERLGCALRMFEGLGEYEKTVVEALMEWEKADEREKIASLEDKELAQFMVLCTFVHFGANQYGQCPVSQKQVIALADTLGLNYLLVDAQSRVTLSPKKHAAAHKAYLAEVEAGGGGSPPQVYLEATDEKTVEKKAKPAKSAVKAPAKSVAKSAVKATAKLAPAFINEEDDRDPFPEYEGDEEVNYDDE